MEMRWNLGKAFILTLILIVFGFVSANAQDGRCCYGIGSAPTCADTLTEAQCWAKPNFISWAEGLDCTTPCEPQVNFASVEMRYESPLWQYTNGTTDSTQEVEIWVNTNITLNASSVTFEPMRNLFRIDSVVWGDTMQAAFWTPMDSKRGILPNLFIKNDVTVGTDVRTYATIGFTPVMSPYGPGIRPTSDFIWYASIYLTFKFDSLNVIKTDSIPFYVDSSFIPPAVDWVFTTGAGGSVVPSFDTDTIGLKYSKVFDIHPGQIPEVFELSQNYPNPFNPDTKIQFAVPTKSYVNLTVYNIRGQKVRTLVDEELDVGWKSVTWDGKDDSGSEVASGIYLYKVVAGDFVESKKMMMLK
jgi:hypothetical protein